TSRPGYSNVAVCVSVMLALLDFWTKMPPDEETRCGQPRPSIQRVMWNMWMHMSPTMPLPYSMNARQLRGWTSLLYGRMGAARGHMSESRLGGGSVSGGFSVVRMW